MFRNIQGVWNYPVNRELKRVRQGHLCLYYAGDTLMEAISYNTCIFTRMPDGRALFNLTRYSVTTAKHQREVWWHASALDRLYGCDIAPVNSGVVAEALVRMRAATMPYEYSIDPVHGTVHFRYMVDF